MEARNKCKTVFRNAADGSHQLAHGCDHGDPARFCNPCAIASYVGVAIRSAAIWEEALFSGCLTVPSATARLREVLWMVVRTAVRLQSVAAPSVTNAFAPRANPARSR
jgi:hypothetical protein